MQTELNKSLKGFNTFGIDAGCRRLVRASSEQDILDFLEENAVAGKDFLVLGGGSNVLFTGDYDGDVLLVDNKGISMVPGPGGSFYVKSAAGEIWDDLVSFCLEKGLCGLENLVMIPGKVGASPIQNIGAYGVEMKDHFYRLEAFDRKTGKKYVFNRDDCEFGYRDSVFKRHYRGRYIIASVTFFLSRTREVNTSYGAILSELERLNISHPGISDVARAVRNIRSSKLPDPEELGNAGSFFKNPTVSYEAYNLLKDTFPDMPAYPQEDGTMKLASGWLIEHCGWKGYREGDAGVHRKQALVLVNYGNATGKDILALSEKIKGSVMEKFGVELDREVQVV